jgi:hypothetical protein
LETKGLEAGEKKASPCVCLHLIEFEKNGSKASSRVARWFVFKPKYQLGKILEGLAMGNVGIFYVYLVHFTAIYFVAIWYILRLFGILFHPFWYVAPRKLWQPWPQARFLFYSMEMLNWKTCERKIRLGALGICASEELLAW